MEGQCECPSDEPHWDDDECFSCTGDSHFNADSNECIDCWCYGCHWNGDSEYAECITCDDNYYWDQDSFQCVFCGYAGELTLGCWR